MDEDSHISRHFQRVGAMILYEKMATLKRTAIDYQALALVCVEQVLEISNEFIRGFKAVIEFKVTIHTK